MALDSKNEELFFNESKNKRSLIMKVAMNAATILNAKSHLEAEVANLL